MVIVQCTYLAVPQEEGGYEVTLLTLFGSATTSAETREEIPRAVEILIRQLAKIRLRSGRPLPIEEGVVIGSAPVEATLELAIDDLTCVARKILGALSAREEAEITVEALMGSFPQMILSTVESQLTLLSQIGLVERGEKTVSRTERGKVVWDAES